MNNEKTLKNLEDAFWDMAEVAGIFLEGSWRSQYDDAIDQFQAAMADLKKNSK